MYIKQTLLTNSQVVKLLLQRGIQRVPKVSIKGGLLGFLNDLTNESTVLPSYLKKPQV